MQLSERVILCDWQFTAHKMEKWNANKVVSMRNAIDHDARHAIATTMRRRM